MESRLNICLQPRRAAFLVPNNDYSSKKKKNISRKILFFFFNTIFITFSCFQHHRGRWEGDNENERRKTKEWTEQEREERERERERRKRERQCVCVCVNEREREREREAREITFMFVCIQLLMLLSFDFGDDMRVNPSPTFMAKLWPKKCFLNSSAFKASVAPPQLFHSRSEGSSKINANYKLKLLFTVQLFTMWNFVLLNNNLNSYLLSIASPDSQKNC